MACARKPNGRPKSPMDEAAPDAFIAGAAKPKAEPIATEADETGQGAEPRKPPVMLRFDRAMLARVDAAAKPRGILRSARRAEGSGGETTVSTGRFPWESNPLKNKNTQ